jgi:hypothetical protein
MIAPASATGTGDAMTANPRTPAAIITPLLTLSLLLLGVPAILFAVPAISWGVPATSSGAEESLTITPDWAAPQTSIPDQFSGMSFETQLLLPNPDGIRYFRPDNQPLITLFKTLGIKHLRIGGNTADNPAVPIPTNPDIDSLFAFAHAAGVKVVYTLRLKGQTDATTLIPTVKYIQDHYAADLDCFALGNEPSVYFKQYPAAEQYAKYKALWDKMTDEIEKAVPGVMFCGPNTDRHYEWAVNFAKDFAASGKVKEINEHAYVGLSARKVTDVVAARDKMLSDDWIKLYQGVYDGFVPQVIEAKLPYRLEETNSFFNGGKEGASDTFTAALWALDYMHWWTRHGAAGINFHTGDKVAAGADSAVCRYAAYVSTDDGYNVHPVGYAIKAFDLGGHGQMISLKTDATEKLNISAYAVLGSDNALYITLINKEHGTAGRDAIININPGKPYVHGQAVSLADTSHDIADKTGITLGGTAVSENGTWTGDWTPLQAPSAVGQFTLTLPAASATIVKLTEVKLTER